MKKFICTLLFLSALTLPIFGFAADIISASETDNADIVSEACERYIDTKNKELKDKCGASIIIATVKSTGEYSLNEYAKDIFKNYKLNSVGKSNNVLVVFCTEKKDYTIMVSDGISGVLTMQKAEKILSEYTEKDFSAKKYSNAAVKTYNGIAKWYNSTYNQLQIKLTDDMSEYETAVKNEHQSEHRRIVNRKIAISSILIIAAIIFLYTKRKLRLIKAKKKRNERKLRYMRGMHSR